MERINCVICDNKLQDFISYDLPLFNSVTIENINNDLLINNKYGVCIKCKSVQLISLLDPKLLYSYPNKYELTPLWLKHHKEFTNFIKLSSNNINSICEIGGGNNGLHEYFENINNYSILDLYEPNTKLNTIKYKIGNCEEYVDYNESTLVLSHTFEHLYNPLKFIKTLQATNVENIFISVPNMKDMLDNKTSISIVFSEHTFYFEKEDILYMFETNGFKSVNTIQFDNHSLFFHFKKSKSSNISIHVKEESMNKLYNLFYLRLNKIHIDINEKYYVMPSHYIGQAAYYSIKNNDNIIGFLDNDLNKIGKRLYGTQLYVYNPELLKNSIETVLLVQNPYYEEMYNQLININLNIKIIPFSLII